MGLKNLTGETVVARSRHGSKSLRTTIPEVMVQLFQLQHGDRLTWAVQADGKVMLVKVAGRS